MAIQAASRLAAVGATAGELISINAGYDAQSLAQRQLVDAYIESIDSAGLLTILAAWRASGGQFGVGFVTGPGGGGGFTAPPLPFALLNTANAFTAPLTLAPSVVNVDGLTIDVPALDGATGLAGLRMFDVAGTVGRMIQLNHAGGVGGGSSLSYALEIRNLAGAGSAVGIHQYSNLEPCFQLDSVQNVAMMQLKNAENAAQAPGVHGTSAYFDFRGYFVPAVSYADGVVAGDTGLTSALMAAAGGPVAEDVGKVITVAGVQNTIQAVGANGSGSLTLQTAATNGSGVTVGYVPKIQAESFSMATLTSDLRFLAGSTTTPFTFTTSAGGVAALKITQPSGAQPALYVISGGSGVGIDLDNSGTGPGLFIFNRTASNAVQITQQTGGVAVVSLTNSGTGPSLDIGPTKFQVLANGQIKFAAAANEATGAVSAALGANCPATTGTAPYTWEKVTTSDGSQGYIPVWK